MKMIIAYFIFGIAFILLIVLTASFAKMNFNILQTSTCYPEEEIKDFKTSINSKEKAKDIFEQAKNEGLIFTFKNITINASEILNKEELTKMPEFTNKTYDYYYQGYVLSTTGILNRTQYCIK